MATHVCCYFLVTHSAYKPGNLAISKLGEHFNNRWNTQFRLPSSVGGCSYTVGSNTLKTENRWEWSNRQLCTVYIARKSARRSGCRTIGGSQGNRGRRGGGGWYRAQRNCCWAKKEVLVVPTAEVSNDSLTSFDSQSMCVKLLPSETRKARYVCPTVWEFALASVAGGGGTHTHTSIFSESWKGGEIERGKVDEDDMDMLFFRH